eukprot:1180149-Amphidinium_carterae.2
MVINSLARTLKASLAARYQVKIPLRHALTEWLYRHAVWLRERYHIDRGQTQTVVHRFNGHKYSHPLPEFGETVLWREPGPHTLKYKEKFGY